MASVYISFVDSDPSHPDLFPPGSIAVHQSCAVLMPNGGEWAYALVNISPSTTETLQQQVALQDGANRTLYFRASPDSAWLLRGMAMVGSYSWTARFGIPQAVLALWGSAGTCPPGIPAA